MDVCPQLPGLKDVLLETVPKLSELVPRTKPTRPVSRMVKFLFLELREAADLSPDLHKPDGRWPRLLDASSNLLLFVSENDGHYAGQIAQAMLLAHDIVEKSRKRFPPGAEGDVAWMEWAAQHGATRVKAQDEGDVDEEED